MNMNALTRDLIRLTEEAEKAADADSRFRQKIHVMPPAGWLNDPNGLCQFGGVFHAYFQYSRLIPREVSSCGGTARARIW